MIGGNGWERNSSSLLPNFFGITQPLGKFQFGFSYAVPDSIQENQNQVFDGSFPTRLGSPANRYIINFNNEDTTYNFGPSLAVEVNSKLAAGMTLYLHHRSKQTILNQMITLQDGRFEWTNQYIELVERGIQADARHDVDSGGKVYRRRLRCKNLPLQRIERHPGDVQIRGLPRRANRVRARFCRQSVRKEKISVRDCMRASAYFASSSLLITADGSYYSKVSDPAR